MTFVKELTCPNCGSPLQQHLLNSQTIICQSCSKHVAVGGLKPIAMKDGRSLGKPVKPIYLGDRFMIRNVDYFVMGRVEYVGWDPSDRSDRWTWTEWLLGADDGRLFWLSYDREDGFVFYRKRYPYLNAPFNPTSDTVLPLANHENVPIDERYPAQVVGAEGELTWLANSGDQHYVAEGKSNGNHFTLQAINDVELSLYVGKPVKEQTIAAALGNANWTHRAESRAEARTWLQVAAGIGFFLALVGLMIGAFGFISDGNLQTTQSMTLNAGDVEPRVFSVDVNNRRPMLIKLNMDNTIPLNSWAEVEVIVTAPDGEEMDVAFEEFWHETGVEEGVRWTENDYSGAGSFVPYQTGTYTIAVVRGEDSGISDPINLTVEVYRNHFLASWPLIYAVLTALGAGFLLYRSNMMRG